MHMRVLALALALMCSGWHKNQRAMQTGAKPDEVGWAVYERCVAGGALIVTGHEHSYSRSYPMSSAITQSVSSSNATHFAVRNGQTVVVVAGLGGESIRSGDTTDYWAVHHYLHCLLT